MKNEKLPFFAHTTFCKIPLKKDREANNMELSTLKTHSIPYNSKYKSNSVLDSKVGT